VLATPMSTVKVATEIDEARAIGVMTLAFSADPVVRWVWPDPQQYLTYFPRFVKAFGGKAFAHKSAYYVDNFAGVALWLPPNVHFDEEAVVDTLQASVSEEVLKDGFSVFEQMAKYHPSEQHWYLPVLGVDPSRHGKGLGSALMQHVLPQCDRDGKLAYLESSNPRNVPFYKRHGFEVMGTIPAGKSHSVFPMLRKPRSQ
jgi:ribosomal protein S18 acetylase RimI-like enzyme